MPHTEAESPIQNNVTLGLPNGEIRELSKRVDTTNALVERLDQRFETHRTRTDEKLEKISEGIVHLVSVQAHMSGFDEGEDRVEDRVAIKHTHRQQFKANVIAAVSLIALLLSGVATVLATVLHP